MWSLYIDVVVKLYRNIVYIITEKLCVVSGRESVHPEPRHLSLCVFGIIVLFIFSAFRLGKHIVHTAGI